MQVMKAGDTAPDFELKADDGTTLSLKSFREMKNVVLCFYPRNHLFACPSKKVFTMAQSVIAVYPEIESLDAVLFAISVDTVKSQKEFVKEYSVPYHHLSDTTRETCKAYAGLNIARMAKRSTFIIDKKGAVREIIRDIDVKIHGRQIVDTLKKIQYGNA